ncbi:MAG: agmatinase [Ignavibacteriales bacterium]
MTDLAWEHPRTFLGCAGAPGKPGISLFGAPLDYTATFRPGSRSGPARIREVSQVLEEYSPALDMDVREATVRDLGDLVLPFGNVRSSLSIIESCAMSIYGSGDVPVMLGGEHLVTLPAVSASSSRCPGMTVIHIDAHADMRDEYLGEKLSHATVMRRVAELPGVAAVHQLGVRSGTVEEMRGSLKGTMYPGEVAGPLKALRSELRGRPVYVSVDIDVLDPAYAPGTGAPEPGGVAPAEILESVLLMKDMNVVGFDLVEVAPPYDHSDITAILAAKIVREAVLALYVGRFA